MTEADPVRWRHVVLTGPMGVGKTTVGRILAHRLGRPLVDSDDQLARWLGRTSRQVVEQDGLPRLHRAEAEALRTAVDAGTPSVIAAAASVGDDPTLIALLAADDLFVVLLECGRAELADRAATGDHRRTVAPDDLEAITTRRSRSLAAVAAVTVDVTAVDPDQVADHVIEALTPPPT